MSKISTIALAAVGVLAIGGAAAAADKPASHVMDVELPDGATAHITYYGNVAPQVRIVPGPVAWAPMAFPRFRNLDAVMAQMERQRQVLMKQAETLSRRPVAARGTPVNVVSYGSAPARTNSVSVVSVTNGSGTCTRTTRVVSQGAGKPPKVTSDLSGTCSAGTAGPQPQSKPTAAHQASDTLDRT
jgi:hypothetical protein